MQPGEVSDVFLTQFGYHIAKLHERVESRTIPLEEVRDAVADEVLKRKRAEAVEAFVDSLKANAVIEEAADE
jgi:parvulin-like peptidyl-prolyl isomerase